MRVTLRTKSLGENKPVDYVTRFLFGGVATAAVGWISHRFGPVVGGLFLAFPALCPASLTLVAKHERQKKTDVQGEERGREVAGVEAAGAALASIGLMGFGGIVAAGGDRFSALVVLLAATVAWAVISGILWVIRQRA